MSQSHSVPCPQCGQIIPLTDQQFERYQGKKVKCPKCGNPIAVPSTVDNVASAGGDVDIPSTGFDVPPPPMPIPPTPPPQPPLSYRSASAPMPRGTPPSQWRDFADFRTMITPRLIIGIFWVGSILLFLGGLISISVAIFANNKADPEQILGGLMIMFLGPLVLRLNCEFIIVIFRINETLTEIKRTADRF
jgi:endogenous inhibitor of DNA gyrase (YacG/DUF329 family)